MRNEECEFSSLKTVSSFDRGETCTIALDDEQTIQSFSPVSLLVESLIQQLCKVITKDPNEQKKLYLTVCQKFHQNNLIGESYEIDEFQFMRSLYQKALFHLFTEACKTASIENNVLLPKNSFPLKFPIENPFELSRYSTENLFESSRYSTEFQEVEFIAKGGFGLVYKAKHNLDGEMYAIKKIVLSSMDVLQNLKEVKLLAKLNHPNIVTYNAAWLEPKKKNKQKLPAILDVEDDIFYNKFDDKDSSLEVVFQGSEESVSIIDESKSQTKTSNESVLMQMERREQRICQISYRSNDFQTSNFVVTLFIQMQLCQRTMRQWLDIRNQNIDSDVNIDLCVDIFKKVVKGVEYIHSQGIVHHDIKPSNIFISEDLSEVQVGDFGLACTLLSYPQKSLSMKNTHPHGQVGTKLYAAPEQLEGICHSKSDIYSLGIVLFELLQPFNTTMERSKVIEQLRSGHMPTKLTATDSNLAKIISESIKSLSSRPTSSELLKSLEELKNAGTLKLVADQNEIIQQLRRESNAKDMEIATLKAKLEELMSKTMK